MALMRQPVGLILIAVLALAQGVLAVLRALEWIQVGADLRGRGVFALPLLSLIAVSRGGLVAIIAPLYVLFAWGALTRQGWAWGLGLIAVLLNGFAVVGLVIEGEQFLVQALLWAVAPVVLVGYLLAPAGRRALLH